VQERTQGPQADQSRGVWPEASKDPGQPSTTDRQIESAEDSAPGKTKQSCNEELIGRVSLCSCFRCTPFFGGFSIPQSSTILAE